MIEEQLLEIIQYAKEAAPHVWELAIREVYASIAESLFWVVCLAATVVSWALKISPAFTERACQAKEEKNYTRQVDLEIARTFGWIISVILTVIWMFSVSRLIRMSINPEFWAIKEPIDLAPGL